MSAEPVRVLALWSPDWPVTAAARAARVPPDRPAAVIVANRVLVCSAVARARGVRRGLRRREAQARCPELAVLTPDPDRDARAFEPVALAVEELAPGVEIVRPGLVALPARGPSGYFGGELAAAERLVDRVAARAGVECQVGVADGLFAAVLAARRGLAVAPGDTPAFLAPLDVAELDAEPDVDRSELVGLLRRLGLRSLGAFGALDPQDVASRFGADAVLCHRLARGLDPRPPLRRRPPEELTVEIELDPPVDRVDAAAFAARGLAELLHRTLAGHGLACTRLGVAAHTVSGERLLRVWRCAEPLTPAGTVDRVRWQLDAWLTRRQMSDAAGPGAVARLWLVPEETVAAGALQLGLWGEVGEADERAGRALVRVQALLGPDSVFTAVLTGGRDPGERVRLVPWGDERGEDGESAGPLFPTDRASLPALAGPPPVELPGRPPPVQQPDGPTRRLALVSAMTSAGPGIAAVAEHAAGSTGAAGAGGAGGPGAAAAGGVVGWVDAAGLGAGGTDGVVGARLPGMAAAGEGAGRRVAAGGGFGPPVVAGADQPRGHPGPPSESVGVGRPGAAGGPDGDPDASRVLAIGAAGPVAPAGWPEDVVRRTGRVSAARVLAMSRDPAAERNPDGTPRSTNRRRRPPARRSTPTPTGPEPPAPWPGRLPAPSPATVPAEPLPAELLDADGRPVWLAEPDRLSAPPHRFNVDGGPARSVEGWAGPWPVRQRWWSPDAVTASRLQLLGPDGEAYLLTARDGRWWVTGIYD